MTRPKIECNVTATSSKAFLNDRKNNITEEKEHQSPNNNEHPQQKIVYVLPRVIELAELASTFGFNEPKIFCYLLMTTIAFLKLYKTIFMLFRMLDHLEGRE